MRVLELFAGTLGWGRAFSERGHEVFSVELDTDFPGVSLYQDIATLTPDQLPWTPDVILASPPCTSFSVMTMGRNWTHDGRPKTEGARIGAELVLATLRLIDQLQPSYFVIENPRARLRSLGFMDELDRRTVWQCQYGRPYAKPTDLWGGFPPSLVLEPTCHNGGDDHTIAPRGSRTGVQGGDFRGFGWRSGYEYGPGNSKSQKRKDASRAVAAIPHGLSLAVCLAAEADLGVRPAASPTVQLAWTA